MTTTPLLQSALAASREEPDEPAHLDASRRAVRWAMEEARKRGAA